MNFTGAAIEEGSLKPGDRLLEVNSVTVDGMTQSEVVALLRNAPLESNIYLIVSRHSTAPAAAPCNSSQENGTPATKTSPCKADSSVGSENIQLSGQDQVSCDCPPQPKKISFDLDQENEMDKIREQQNSSPMQSVATCMVEPHSMQSTSPITSSDNYDDIVEEFQFPWKQRQILTFDIPVHDSERAGLGVSVKGKNSNGKDGGVSEDLGIFVKSVLYGGAASQDGRLKTNDQLVNINGMSLLGKTNAEAMETLRKAMHEEGPIPGVISLTVARRYTDSKTELRHDRDQHGRYSNSQDYDNIKPQNRELISAHHERGDSLSSANGAGGGVTSSDESDNMVREYNIAQAQPNFKMPLIGLMGTRNPVVDRLMGKDGSHHVGGSVGIVPANLRNDSYYMATHENTFLNSAAFQQQLKMQSAAQTNDRHQPSKTTSHSSSTSISAIGHQQHQPIMIERSDDANLAQDTGDELPPHGNQTAAATPSSMEDADATAESLTSLVDVSQGPKPFARDQPGRQSMSEKRHATLDAKNTDTYQKRKKAREDRDNKQRFEQQQRMWKKSASLESLHLQTAEDHELAEAEREALRTAYVRANSVRVSRNRGCNESFRAAVDRSYEQRDFPGVHSSLQQHARDNHQLIAGHHNPDFVIEDLDDRANEENQSSKTNVPPQAVVMRRNKGAESSNTKDKKNNRNSRLLTGLSNMFNIGGSHKNRLTTEFESNEGSQHNSMNPSNRKSAIPTRAPLPSNSSSTTSGGSTSAVAGGSSAGVSSSSSLPAAPMHHHTLPASHSIHGTLAQFVKSKSGGSIQNPPATTTDSHFNSMKHSTTGDNLVRWQQLQTQRHHQQVPQHPYYQQQQQLMHHHQPRRPAPVFDQQRHLQQWKAAAAGSSLYHGEEQLHGQPRSHSHPRHPPKDMYDYLPSSMMRPGSRVGIVDPLSTASTDYDVIQRLQQQPPASQYPPPSSQRQAPPPPPQHPMMHTNFSYGPYYQGAGPSQHTNQHFHMRSGSNLSSGSHNSNNNNPSSSSLNTALAAGGKPRRPKSNFYEYELYTAPNNNNHGNYADVGQHPVAPFGDGGSTQQAHHHPGGDYSAHHHQQAMYSLPRSATTTIATSINKLQSHNQQQQYFHTDYN